MLRLTAPGATSAPTLTQALIPARSWLLQAALVLLGSVVVALCAQVTIPIQPVPITGSTFGVLVVGTTFGSRRGALALLAYLAEGLGGLPVFQGGNNAWSLTRSGEPYILGSTLGFLVGFVLAAFVVGWLVEHWALDRTVWSMAALMLVGNVALYVPGLIWLWMWLPVHGLPTPVLQAGLIPFIPGDLAKLLLAALVVPAAWQLAPPGASAE